MYQREPHARQMGFDEVVQPRNYDERCALAERTREELELHDTTILVDGMDDQSRALFGDLPSPAIIVGPDGLVLDKLPWAEPAVLGPRLDELVVEATARRVARQPDEGASARLVRALTAVRSQGAPTGLELEQLADAVAALPDGEVLLAALGLVELVRHTAEPGLFGMAEGAVSEAFAGEPTRHAALLSSLAAGFVGDPRTAAVIEQIDDLAGREHAQQKAWARTLRKAVERGGPESAGIPRRR